MSMRKDLNLWLDQPNNMLMFDEAPILTDKYQVGKTLGSGSFAQVFKGCDLCTNKEVALKKVVFNDTDPRKIKTIKSEVHYLRRFDHENVIKMFDLCRVRSLNKDNPNNNSKNVRSHKSISTRCIVMVLDYCDITLDEMMKLGVDFSDGHKKMILKQLLTALKYMHSKNIIHRDVKPANVFIKKNGLLVLGDLGFAINVADINQDLIKGTPAYMPLEARPSQMKPFKYDFKVDIWSVGCILFNLFTEQHLFDFKSESFVHTSWKNIFYSRFISELHLSLFESIIQRRVLKVAKNSGDTFALALEFFQVEKDNRPSAQAALDNKYFSVKPNPENLAPLVEEAIELKESEAK